MDAAICKKQCLIQQQLAQSAQGCRNVLISPQIISGSEDSECVCVRVCVYMYVCVRTSYWTTVTAAVSVLRFMIPASGPNSEALMTHF